MVVYIYFLSFHCGVPLLPFTSLIIFNRTIESLYEELVKEGIIIQYPKIKIKDYLGEYSYLGTTLRQANIEPMPSLSDVRRVISEYCILPLGKVST